MAPKKSKKADVVEEKTEDAAVDAEEPDSGIAKVADEAEAAELAAYVLTHKMAPFLDTHLLLAQLHFLKETGIYKQEDLTRAELQLVNGTSMIDLAADKYAELGEEVPDDLQSRKEEIVNKVEEVGHKELPLLNILEDPEEVKRMNSMKNLDEMCEQFDVKPEVVEGLVAYAKLRYDCGDYKLSAELLKYYRIMRQNEPETSKSIASLWGSIASQLLSNDFEPETLAENIESLVNHLETANRLSRKEVLLSKTWLLHWALWAIFKCEEVPQKALQIFLHEKSLSIISLSCPHLFRYVAACLILQKRLKKAVEDTVAIIHLEAHAYRDPITRFLVALYTELDFDGAQQELQQCKNVCKADFFLSGHWNDFEENARLMIFETYCQIHQCIYIEMIASKLNMSPAEAELWIVKLIQGAKLDARIDSEKHRVVMSKPPADIYRQVIEKTKNLSFRSTMLLSNLEKQEAEKAGKAV
jgi:translation initiation factor 3 subunit E